jgi:small subunit ribosomal protein S16
MLRIRLRRMGKKKQPMYRIVVADSAAPRDGAFVENLGYYHPLNEPSVIQIDEDRAKHWLGKGATPSTRVAKIFQIQGIAELPPKVATRIALGEKRKEEAKSAAAQRKAEEATATAEAEAPAATAEAPSAETPAAEAEAEAPADSEAAEPEAEEAPAEEAEGGDEEQSE